MLFIEIVLPFVEIDLIFLPEQRYLFVRTALSFCQNSSIPVLHLTANLNLELVRILRDGQLHHVLHTRLEEEL